MAEHKKIQLTEVESTLRRLLLDVAEYIQSSPSSTTDDSSVTIPDQLVTEPLQLRFTGGWVRDKLLGVTSHDIDIAINKMTGYHFGLRMQEYLEVPENAAKYGMGSKDSKSKSKLSGGKIVKIEANPEKSKNLETATTRLLGLDLDLVNLRTEVYSEESRNPEIKFGTPKEDALRRDATVNAMFYNLHTDQVEDFTQRGLKDMDLKIIRTPLEPFQTFTDDPLRVLRLIRFASRLNYSIEPSAETAMSNEEIKRQFSIKITRERVGVELEKMLKGPDPKMALSLINRLDLYQTIFTDVSKPDHASPDISLFEPAYHCLYEILTSNESSHSSIKDITMMDKEDEYNAWLLAAVVPYADAPLPESQNPSLKAQYLVMTAAREGIKAPNKVCSVINESIFHFEEIRQLKDNLVRHLKSPPSKETEDSPAARDMLGMAIRRWGSKWRSQVIFALLNEVAHDPSNKNDILSSYSVFLKYLVSESLVDAYALKPIINGSQLAKALGTPTGPWMKEALDVVMAWQLKHPGVTDPSAVIETLKSNHSFGDSQNAVINGRTKGMSELPISLATHFLQLTIRPLFVQSKSGSQSQRHVTSGGRRRDAPLPSLRYASTLSYDNDIEVPWKAANNQFAFQLYSWIVCSLPPHAVEANWPLLIPPILTLLDDVNSQYKIRGCNLLLSLLNNTPPELLKRTGLGDVFSDAVTPLLSYLPTLTPDDESKNCLDAAFPILLKLIELEFPSSDQSKNIINKATPTKNNQLSKRERALDSLLRDGVLSGLSTTGHGQHPSVAQILLKYQSVIIERLGVLSVKHLGQVIPMISITLTEPLVTLYPPLVDECTKALETVLLNAWPRIIPYRAEILKGICVCWIRLDQDASLRNDARKAGQLRASLKEVVALLTTVLEGKVDYNDEFTTLIEADKRLAGLLQGGE